MKKIYLFGIPRLLQDEQPIKMKRRKSLALLSYLVMRLKPVARDVLATLLWGDYDQERARSELRVSLWDIKQALGEDSLLVDRDSVQINPHFPVWIDVVAFQEELAALATHQHSVDDVCVLCPPHLEAAYGLYTDHFLAGFYISENPDFESWQTAEARALQTSYAQILKKLVWANSAMQQLEAAQRFAQQWLAIDRYDEEANRSLMLVHAWAGNKAAALQHYATYQQLLDNELGVEPTPETTALYEALKADNIPILPLIIDDISAELATSAHNLPTLSRPFRGRSHEVEQVVTQLLRADCRLLTIAGLGGAGKTYLATHVAHGLSAYFPDGVFFVSLAGAATRYAIVTDVADAVGFQFVNKADLDQQLFTYLAPKQLLLVLDNFEHLIEHASFVDALLQAGDALKVLATSRVPLNLKAEFVFTLDQMTDGATELFIDSATRTDAAFVANADDHEIIERICQQLAGVPLAIELAAAWVRVLSLAEILTEIERDVEALSTDWVDVPTRHRSLQATFDYSWQLLTTTQRQALAALSIFPSDFGYDAAKAITHINPSMLASLAAQQLLKRATTGRYELHPLVRQFAYTKLGEDPIRFHQIAVQYIGYFNQFLADRYPSFHGESLLKARDEILQEIDAIRFAVMVAIEQRCPEAITDAVRGLGAFYDHQGWYHEARTLFQQLAFSQPNHTQFILRVKGQLGRFERLCGELQAARLILMQVITHAKPYPAELAYGYLQLYYVEHLQNQRLAFEHAENAYEIYEELTDRLGMGTALYNMAIAASYVSSIEVSIDYTKQALQTLAPFGEFPQVGALKYGLAHFYSHLGDFSEALGYIKQSIAIYQRFELIDPTLKAKITLASVYNRIAEYDLAKPLLEECVQVADHYQIDETLVLALLESATNAWARQDFATSIAQNEQALAVSEKRQMRSFATSLRINLAINYTSTQNYAKAIAYAQQAILELEGMGNDYMMSAAQQTLAEACLEQGDFARAHEAFRQSIRLGYQASIKVSWLSNLVQLGRLYHLEGQTETGVLLINHVLQDDGTQSIDREGASRVLDQIRNDVGSDTVDRILDGSSAFDIHHWLVETGILQRK